MTAPQRPSLDELETIRDLAMAANAALYSREEIEESQRRSQESRGKERSLIPDEWAFVDRKDLAVRNNNETTGLHAYAFRKSEREVVIAYRSADDANDHDLKRALQSDGPLAADLVESVDPLGFGPGAETSRQLEAGQRALWGDYHPQMADALRYFEDVRRAYPNDDITLTGFREGASLAALVGNATGTRTEAFDPLGTLNAEQSAEWRTALASRNLRHPELKPEGFIDGLHEMPRPVTSWALNHGDAAKYGGPQVGDVQMLSGRAGREGVGDWTAYTGGIVLGAAERTPLLDAIGNRVRAAGAVADGVDWATRANVAGNVGDVPRDDRDVMQRIVRAFDEGVQQHRYPGWRGQNDGQEPTTPEAPPRKPEYAGPAISPVAPSASPVAVADPKLLETIRGHCATLGKDHGWGDEQVERAASALYAQCRQEYVDRIDGVVFGIKGTKAEAGDNLFAYGKQANGFDDRVYVGTVAAMGTPANDSLARAQTLDVQRAQEQQLEQQMAQQRGPEPDGPTRTM